MRTIKLCAWFLVAFSLTIYAGLANAGAPITTWAANWPGGSTSYSTLDEACDAWVIYRNTTAGYTVTKAACRPPHSGNRINYSDPGLGNTSRALVATTVCANGSRPDTSKPLASQCPDVDPPPVCFPGEQVTVTYKRGAVGSPVDSGYWPLWPNEPHDGQCNVNCTDGKSEVKSCFERSGNDFCTWVCEKTGNVKSSNTDANAPAAPRETNDPRKDIEPFSPKRGDCPKGTVQIGVSSVGTPQCLGTGTDPKNSPAAPPKIETEKNETLPDGSVKNTKTVTTTNTDLSKTTITTVTITKSNGEKEINQDKKTTDTPSGKPGAETPPQSDLCKQNPNLAVCKNSSVSGKCGEITCTGDAIQCATLRAAAAMECKQRTDEEALKAAPQTTLGQKILDGADPMQGQIDIAMKGTEIDLSKPQLDQTAFLGGGSCLPNKTMSVMGRSVTVEFAQLCTNIQPLRGVVMACAFILAYMIVSRSVLQG